MSSLIEQAAQRLEQLRQAGAEVPGFPLEPAKDRLGLGPQQQPRTPAITSKRVELDEAKLIAMGLLPPTAPRSLMADQYRVIKRPLIQNAVGKGASTITHS